MTPPRRSRSLDSSPHSPSRRVQAERRDVAHPISFIDNDDGQHRPRSPRRRQSPVTRSASRRRSSRSPSPTHPTAPPRKRFGLTTPAEERKYIGKFDFEDKYPEDPIYEELGPNARVWRANMDECEIYDNDMVNEARDGLDLLLVFAGLFSAVLSTFVAQTSQALSNNFPAVSTSLLLEMVTLQRALINGTSTDNVPSTELTSGPSGFDVWVNALWFTSLTLSLGTALMAVLVKQWLHQYMSATSGTPRDRSLIRHYRFEGLRKWRVLTIIGILPVVLHVALGVFLAGLVVLLIPLNIPLACVIGFITFVIYVLYAVSNILPILYVQCPYRTPFSDTLNALMRPLLAFIVSSSLLNTLFRPIQFLFNSTGAVLTAIVDHTRSFRLLLAPALALAVISIRKAFPTSTSTSAARAVYRTLKDAERMAATSNDVAEDIACDALLWLYHATSNPPTKSVILQSVGCLSDMVSDKLAPLASDIEPAISKSHGQACDILPEQVNRTERLLRAYRHIYNPNMQNQMWCFGREWAHPPFRPVTSVMVRFRGHEQAIFANRRQGSEQDLLVTIIKRHGTDPVLFPPALWQHLFDRCLRLPRLNSMLEDTDLALTLCGLALENFRIGQLPAAPFSAGVDITHGAVPLFKFVVILLFQLPSEYDFILSKALWELLRINDFLLSILSSGHDHTPRVVSNITYVWLGIYGQVQVLPTGLPPDDYQALCCKVENTALRIFPDGWLDAPEATRAVTMNCHHLICEVYHKLVDEHDLISYPDFLFMLLSHLCLSLKTPSFQSDRISSILCTMLDRDVEYLYLTFCLHSFFSTPTVPRIILDHQFAAYSVIIAFASGIARGNLPPRVTLR